MYKGKSFDYDYLPTSSTFEIFALLNPSSSRYILSLVFSLGAHLIPAPDQLPGLLSRIFHGHNHFSEPRFHLN